MAQQRGEMAQQRGEMAQQRGELRGAADGRGGGRINMASQKGSSGRKAGKLTAGVRRIGRQGEEMKGVGRHQCHTWLWGRGKHGTEVALPGVFFDTGNRVTLRSSPRHWSAGSHPTAPLSAGTRATAPESAGTRDTAP
eukprot:363640-Chlamydomonas_euryale.AAC.4